MHAEAHRPSSKAMPSRYARHYYDVYRMIQTGLALQALEQPDLLTEVVAFKQKFYPMSWANYHSATLHTILLKPGQASSFAHMMKSIADFHTHMHSIKSVPNDQ